MGKVLMINGSPNERGCTYTALKEVADILYKEGIDSEIMWIGKRPVQGCIACGRCLETGDCVFDDQVNMIIDDIDNIDALILGSPVYFAAASGQLCALLDRLFNCSGYKWSLKPGAAVVSCRRGGATAAFDRLNKYFTMHNMPIVSSQYWNQVHGYVPEDVLQDIEGLQTMRTLAQNMAWMLKNIEAGKQAGITKPEYEDIIETNFIR